MFTTTYSICWSCAYLGRYLNIYNYFINILLLCTIHDKDQAAGIAYMSLLHKAQIEILRLAHALIIEYEKSQFAKYLPFEPLFSSYNISIQKKVTKGIQCVCLIITRTSYNTNIYFDKVNSQIHQPRKICIKRRNLRPCSLKIRRQT